MVSLLLSTNRSADASLLYWLGKCCIQRNIINLLIDIFDSMMSTRKRFSPQFPLFDENSDEFHLPTEIDLELNSDHHSLKEFWVNCLLPNLNALAEIVLERVVMHLETRHRTFCTWYQADFMYDPNWERFAIEHHEMNDGSLEAIDLVIDIARDVLCWLAENQENRAAYWTERLAVSKAPILRRLSVFTVNVRGDLSADNKIQWLVDADRLHDAAAHHEVFELAKHSFWRRKF